MKRKFIILTLCFTIMFSSLNIKKSYAIDFVISPTILAVVSTLAVGTGIVLKNSDDVLDIGRLFYDYVERNNSLTWDFVKTTFESAKALNDTILINSDILDITKGFFDETFPGSLSSDIKFVKNYNIPIVNSSDIVPYVSRYIDIKSALLKECKDFTIKGVKFIFNKYENKYYYYNVYVGDTLVYNSPYYENILNKFTQMTLLICTDQKYSSFGLYAYNPSSKEITVPASYSNSNFESFMKVFGGLGTLPYNGGYSWDNVEDKKDQLTGDLPLPIPGNLGDLVGKNPSDVWDKNYENGLLGDKPITYPNVDNPSIGIGGVNSFPNVSVENPPTDIPDVENPPVGVIPPFPSFGDSLDFSPMYLTNINEKFPFSLPWDIGRLIEKFDVEPKAPIFKVPIVTSDIELDLTIFDEWANIVRFFILIGFALSLILISTKLLG